MVARPSEKKGRPGVLILNNGAPKSGTTWVQKICVKMLDPDFPDRKWRNFWKNPSIDPEKLQQYHASREWQEGRVLVKTHFAYEPKYSFLLEPNVRIIVTSRNLPDSVLSWFYHQVRKKGVGLEEKDGWLGTVGFEFADRLIEHRHTWRGKSNVLDVRYEDMLADAPGKVAEIAAFLDADISPKRAARIAERTQQSLAEGEAPRNDRHVRTGGQSTALQEIPPDIYDRLVELDRKLA